MHARTPKAHIPPSYDAEPEDDETAWLLLRARTELTLEARQVTEALPPPAPPLPRRPLPHARASTFSVPSLAFNESVPTPAFNELVSTLTFNEPVPTPAFNEYEDDALYLLDDDDALPSPSSRRRALPVLLLTSLVAGLFTTALIQHLVAEAEQQAQIEEVISDIQRASAQLPASTQGELQRPFAEAPASETLRAFQKLSAEAVPLRSLTSTRTGPNMAQPSRGNAVHQPPAARAVVKATPLPRATTRPKGVERKIEPDLSDDPLRDL